MGIPYIPTPGLAGSDLFEARHDFLLVPNPFRAGEQVVVVPALEPDFTVLHTPRADRRGNTLVPSHSDAHLLAEAARSVIITTEQLVGGTLTENDLVPGEMHLASIHVDAVVEAPGGARPGRMAGLYDADREEYEFFMERAKAGEFEQYLDRYVFTPAGAT